MTRVLVTGGAGQLGRQLIAALSAQDMEVVATSHRSPVDAAESVALDIRDRAAVEDTLAGVAPGLVFHTAYDSQDWRTTAEGAAHVAAATARVGGTLVHISSDAVFSGRVRSYAEDATPDPVNPYGAAKAAAEVAVRAVLPQATIVRTSLILGGFRAPMERLTHELVTGEREGVLFTDDIRCPVHVADLAAAVIELAGRPGTFHVAGVDALSRHEIGVLVCRRDGLDESRLSTGLRALLPTPGPLDLRLDCTRTQALLGTRLRGAREFLSVPTR